MKSFNELVWNDIGASESTLPLETAKKKAEITDFLLGGRIHSSTVNHHRIMENLRPNEIRFTVNDSLEMLDDPSSGHLTRNYLNSTTEMNVNQSHQVPRVPKGIYKKTKSI